MTSPKVSVFVRSKEQLNFVRMYDVHAIYTDVLELVQENPELYYQVPKYHDASELPDNILTEDTGLLYDFKDKKNIITDYGLNVANEKTISLLEQSGASRVTLSLEVSMEELSFFKNLKKYSLELYLYGRPKVMCLKEHPIFTNGEYILEDMKKKRYPVTVLENKNVFLYHHEPIDRLRYFQSYRDIGIQYFRIDLWKETNLEIAEIFERICLQKKNCQEFTES